MSDTRDPNLPLVGDYIEHPIYGIWEVTSIRQKGGSVTCVDPKDSSSMKGNSGEFYDIWFLRNTSWRIIRKNQSSNEINPENSASDQYCSCVNPNVITNTALGQEFQVCRSCKKERR